MVICETTGDILPTMCWLRLRCDHSMCWDLTSSTLGIEDDDTLRGGPVD